MRATIYLIDDNTLTIEDFDPASALDMVADLHETRFAQFQMDDATVIVNTDHIVRIDLEDAENYQCPANPIAGDHAWAEVTELQDQVKRFACAYCPATKEEPR